MKASSEAFFFAPNYMRCIELITQDHLLLRRGLDIVDGMIKKLEDGERIEIVDVTAILKFLRLFGDQYHQAMEETLLFPTLLRRAPDETALRQLVTEHGDERILVAQIEDALISRRGMAFFRSSRQLTALLRHHCEREETILRDLTERCLSRDQNDEVVAEFTKVRKQAEIYTDLSRLQLKYPPKPAPQPVGSERAFSRGV